MYLPGRIVAKRAASPTVTLLDLCVPKLQIQPGQWLDFRIPSAAWIGGYSLAKQQLPGDVVQIAVKASNHAPAAWVTQESKVEDEVLVQAGGTCVLHANNATSAVFIAGGIGVSPLLALYRQHVCENRPRVRFYYSISTEEEFVFEDEIVNKLVRPEDSLTVTLTQSQEWQSSAKKNVHQMVGRQHLLPFLNESISSSSNIYYVCGPQSMQDYILEHLEAQKVPPDHVVYEKWW